MSWYSSVFDDEVSVEVSDMIDSVEVSDMIDSVEVSDIIDSVEVSDMIEIPRFALEHHVRTCGILYPYLCPRVRFSSQSRFVFVRF